MPEPEPNRLPFDPGWFTEAQHDHLGKVIVQPNGFALVVNLYNEVRRRVEICREHSLTSGHTIRTVMRQTRAGQTGIDQADLLPVTRGLISAVFQELDNAGH